MTTTVGSPKDVGPRFQLVTAIPTALFVVYVGALVLAGAPSQPLSLKAIEANIANLGLGGGTLLLVGTLGLGIIVHPFQYALVQLMEGYWVPKGPIAPVFESRVKHHRRRRSEIDSAGQRNVSTPHPAEDSAEAEVFRRAGLKLRDFPAPLRVLPTELGNVLRAREDLAGKLFELDAIQVVPRLYPLMPPLMVSMLEDHRNQLDLMCRMTATWLIATPVSIALLWRQGFWASLSVLTYGLAWLSYRASIAAARTYGNLIVRAVDMYRLELLRKLHFPPPRNIQSERRLHQVANAMFNRSSSADEYDVTTFPFWHEDWRSSSRPRNWPPSGAG